MNIAGSARYTFNKIKQYPHYQSELKKIKERRSGNIPQEFMRLKELRGRYAGQRCFIVGSLDGASEQTLEKLRGELVIAVSDAVLKSISPTYFGVQNPASLLAFSESGADVPVLLGDNLLDRLAKANIDAIPYPYLGVYKYYDNRFGEHSTRFSEDALAVVYDGYSVVYSMMQIAVYMGASEIILIGCGGNADRRVLSAYENAKKYASEHGIAILRGDSASDDGIFPVWDGK